MLIDNLDRGRGGSAAPVIGDKAGLWPFFLEGIVDELVALVVAGATVLVADLDKLEAKGLGVAVLGALRSPLGRFRVTIGVLQRIEGILHHLIHLCKGSDILVAHAAVDHEERLCLHVLAPLEVLVEAKAVGGRVAPDTLVFPALLRGSQRRFPVKALGERVALHKAAAGEAHEARLHPRHQLA